MLPKENFSSFYSLCWCATKYKNTRSLGALRAPTSSWRPFRRCTFCPTASSIWQAGAPDGWASNMHALNNVARLGALATTAKLSLSPGTIFMFWLFGQILEGKEAKGQDDSRSRIWSHHWWPAFSLSPRWGQKFDQGWRNEQEDSGSRRSRRLFSL